MTTNRPQTTMTTRQKVTAGVFVIVLGLLLWQIFGMFKGPTPPPAPTLAVSTTTPGQVTPPATGPKPAHLIKTEPLSPREQELMRLQQETQVKYIAALNELQMLKLSREIAETNQAIATAKLQTVTSQKQIVDLLSPTPAVSPQSISQGLVGPVPAGVMLPAEPPPPVTAAPSPPLTPAAQPSAFYRVVSITQLRSRWSAVVGFQNNLYNVMVGDILPPDRSRVISIDKSGVVLEREGMKRRVSLVPLI